MSIAGTVQNDAFTMLQSQLRFDRSIGIMVRIFANTIYRDNVRFIPSLESQFPLTVTLFLKDLSVISTKYRASIKIEQNTF